MHRTQHETLRLTIAYLLPLTVCLILLWIFLPATIVPGGQILLILIFLVSLVYTVTVHRIGRRRERDLQHWLDRLQHAMSEYAPEGDHSDSERVLELARRHAFRSRLLLENFSDTAVVVAGVAERVSRLLATAERTLERLEPAVHAVATLDIDATGTTEETTPDDGLSERITRLRFELENFTDTPKALLQQLQMIYQRYLTETDQLLTSQETMLEELSNQLSRLNDRATELVTAGQESEDRMARLSGDFQDLLKGMAGMMRTWETMGGVLNACESQQPAVLEAMSACPSLMDTLKTQLLDLGAITNRTKILSLNATVYAADAGEAGLGFATIAREMKTLAAESEQAQQELRDTLASLNTTLTASLEGVQSFYSHLEQTRHRHETLGTRMQQLQHTLDAFRTALATARTSQETLASQLHHHGQRIQSMHQELSEPRKQVGARRKDLTSAQALKYEIDRMVIDTDRFSERLSGEMPLILESLGAVLDSVSSLQDQLMEMQNAIRTFHELDVSGRLTALRKQLTGPDTRLLGDVPRMLAKSRPRKPIEKTS